MILFLAAGSVAQKYIDKGIMVPDVIMVDLIVDELHKMKTSSWLLDGNNKQKSHISMHQSTEYSL